MISNQGNKEEPSSKEASKEVEQKEKVPSLLGLILSILAAAIGVQKRKNLENDFQQSNPIPFIIGGIVFTLLFLGALILIVTQFVL